MTKLNGKCEGIVDVKRFYLPGIVLESNCPRCGILHKKDMGKEYLSYPRISTPTKIYFYCENEYEGPKKYCNTDWNIEVSLDISLKLEANDKTKRD